MEKKKIEQAITLVKGLKKYEWEKIKQAVDYKFSTEASQRTLDDVAPIENSLKGYYVNG